MPQEYEEVSPRFSDYAVAVLARPFVYAFWRARNGPIEGERARKAIATRAWRSFNLDFLARAIRYSKELPKDVVSINYV